MTTTPKIVIVEEHHEVFYAWFEAVSEGLIPREGNLLLHVDEHPDTAVPRLYQRLESTSDLTAVKKFVYGELNISNFIWPAVYYGLVNRLVWFRRSHDWGSYWRPMAVRSTNAAETQFVVDADSNEIASDAAFPNPRCKQVDYALMTPADTLISRNPVLLDIDLDYFCSNQFPNHGRQRVEITREAYETFESDLYHVLRIAPGMKARAIEEGGRYYLIFNDYAAEENTCSREDLETRMDDFFAFLRMNQVNARLVTICRSLHSGYLPRKLAGYIEERVLARLEEWSRFSGETSGEELQETIHAEARTARA